MKPILVTGATGFIGREVVRRLTVAGMSVRAMALPQEHFVAFPQGVEVVRADVTQPQTLKATVAGASAVVHLAAVVGDWGDESVFEAITVGGTRNMVTAARDAGVGHFVHISSVVCYAHRVAAGPCTEETPHGKPFGPYSRTKQSSEVILTEAMSIGFPATVIRPGNVYGPGSAYWVVEPMQYIKKGRALLIDGGHGDAGLVSVSNVAQLIELALRKPDRSAGEIFNASDGHGVTWRAHFDFLAGLAGEPPVRRSLPYGVASAAARLLEGVHKLAHLRARPMLTRESLNLIGHANVYPNRKARERLGYEPVSYAYECDRIRKWWSEASRASY